MSDVISLASTGLAFFIVAVSPGPATISNAAVAMRYGRKTGLLYGAGLSCGLGFWGLVAATGLGAVLQGSLHLLMVLKVLGGLYLLWLALLSARSARQTEVESRFLLAKQSWFLQGLLLNLSNPKAVIAWMASLSVGLGPEAGIDALVAATAMCIALGAAVYAFYSVLFSVAGVMRGYQRCRRWVEGVAAGLFALAGLGLLRSAFNR